MVINNTLEKQGGLTERLKEAARAYYDGNAEIMGNLEYDRLYDELVAMEQASGVVFAGSPTQRVGYEVSSELVKQTHPAPMLSLNKTKDAGELVAWLGEQAGLLSYKLDGLTVALTYEGGELVGAVTRGNGVVGEVVTAGARTFANLPLKIPYAGRLVLRGEAVIRYSDFEAINREIEDVGAKYKNPRNLASGSVRQLDSAVTSRRRVRFYAFALVEGGGGESRKDKMDFLRTQGFEAVRSELVAAATLGDAIARFSQEAAAGGLDLPVDGLVLEYDDTEYSASLGATAKYPRDAMAFKWEDEEAETGLVEIEWSASRTGLINPIAVFEPVELEGTTVSRASVHNVSILEELALGKGDRIKVYKANMIIPQISENLTRSGTERPPSACPVCGAQTEINDADGIKTLHCTNGNCPAKRLKAFTHFVSRTCMNIEGLSEQTLEKFIAAGFLHELADVFRLSQHQDVIVDMEGFGYKSYENLIAAIDKARATTADRLLVALGIPEIGTATAKAIARSFGNDWDRIESADLDTLTGVPGVGGTIADLYTAWFADPANRAAVSNVVSEVRFADPPAPSHLSSIGDEPLPLAGLAFVITGSLEGYKSREQLVDRIESLGGRVSSSVSPKTDYLINNDASSPSSKNKKARALGIAVITEPEFEALATQL
ncbi:MAG: NAD-dependent DNA ligase LigA [Clostridiales bacterium]|nr:NAD-dependent DNA ligase LigA [Clostridiales bacterium]